MFNTILEMAQELWEYWDNRKEVRRLSQNTDGIYETHIKDFPCAGLDIAMYSNRIVGFI